MISHPSLKTLCRYLDGELGDRKTQDVAAHLGRCPICRQKIAPMTSLDETRSNLGGVSEETAGRFLNNLPQPAWRNTPAIATVEIISGDCQVQPATDSSPIDAFEGLGLKAADRLWIKSSSRIAILLNDGSRIWLNSNTTATLENGESSLHLSQGELFAQMQSQSSPFTVQTPTARLTVVGTTFEAGVTAWESTFLRVLAGEVSFRNQAGICHIRAKKEVDATAHQPPIAQKIRKVAEVARWVCAPLPGDNLFADPKEQAHPRRLPIVFLSAGLAILLLFCLGWFGFIRPNLPVESSVTNWQPPRQTSIDDTRTLVITNVQWPVGYRFIYQFEMNINSQRTKSGQNRVASPADEPEQTLKQSQQIILDVTGRRHNGARDVSMSFRNIKFEIRHGDQGLVIDSQSEARERSQNPFAAILRAQQNARFDVRVSPDGEILAFSGFAPFKESVLAQVGPDEAALLDEFLNEGFYQRMFMLSLMQSPSKQDGDLKSWVSNAPFGDGEKNAESAKAHYVFDGWDLHNGYQCALWNVTMDGSATKDNLMPNGKGQVWYDPSLGMIIKTIWTLDRQTLSRADATSDPASPGKISQYLLCRLINVEKKLGLR